MDSDNLLGVFGLEVLIHFVGVALSVAAYIPVDGWAST
jgi:hypothetical protein